MKCIAFLLIFAYLERINSECTLIQEYMLGDGNYHIDS
jgi:hypothetical protein